MEVTNEMLLAAISDLSGFVQTLTEDMVEVKSDITGMKQEISGMKVEISGMKQEISGMKQDISGIKEEISGIKQEMQQMNEKIDKNAALVKRIDSKLTIFSEDLVDTRADVLQLQRAK